MSDAAFGEGRQADFDTGLTGKLVEVSGIVVPASGGPLVVGGLLETGSGSVGTLAVGGGTPHDSVDSGNPVKVGGRASSTIPTAVATGDRVQAWYGLNGQAATMLVDSSGNAVSVGGGTQYAEDTALGSTPTGTLSMARRVDSLSVLTPVVDDAISLRVNDRGALWVQIYNASSNLGVQGDVVHDAVDSGNAVKIGGKYTTTPSAVSATGDRVDAQFDQMGKLGTFIGDRQNNNYAFVGPGPADNDGASVGSLYTSARLSGYDGSTWDNVRVLDALGGVTPNVDTGILAVGLGPGFDRKRNPSNLGTAANSAVTIPVDGADVITIDIGTGTTGTITLEYTTDDSNWATHSSALKLGAVDLWWDGVAFSPVAQTRYMLRTTGLRQVRVRTVTTLGATVAIKWTASVGTALLKGLDNDAPPHAIGYAIASATAQYSTTQTSTTLGPTVSSTQRLVVTSIQIQAGGTTAGTLQVYFGTGAYSRGTNKAIFDGEFAPSSTLKPGYALAPSVPWMGAADEELKVTDSAAINPLTVTIWYYLITA